MHPKTKEKYYTDTAIKKLYSAIKYFLTRARELWINTSANTVNLEDDDEMDLSLELRIKRPN